MCFLICQYIHEKLSERGEGDEKDKLKIEVSRELSRLEIVCLVGRVGIPWQLTFTNFLYSRSTALFISFAIQFSNDSLNE